ncbi:siderophore ABC transporter substrate-binding protein [Lysinibacillus sp. LZ02]|uniref:siderophore ABC transporter substrate-binding protein n=1 Tax=Lysinibacillus sp. LZ02 TaxID=3420668 RepID=UPI003D35EB65
MKNWKLLSVILAMLVFVLAACGSSEEEAQEETNTGSDAQTEEQTDAEESAYPVTIESTIEGYEPVTFEKAPEKIVVFDLGFLDTLTALGVEADGVPTSKYAGELEKYNNDSYTKVGSLKEPDFETIYSLQPDVIFISGRQASFKDQLEEIAPVVFVGTSSEDYWNTFLASTKIAADLFGAQEEVDAKVADIEAAIEEVKTISADAGKALVTLYSGTLSAYGPDAGSRYGFVHSVLGFESADTALENSTHGQQVDLEYLVKVNPDVVFVVDRTQVSAEEGTVATAEFFNNELVNKTAAAQNGKIVYLDGVNWYVANGGLNTELAKVQEIIDELK